jgi:acyl-CoA hydrolase
MSPSPQRHAFICDAVRTPFGRYGGALANVRADDLGAVPLAALMARNPGVDWQAVTDDQMLFRQPSHVGELVSLLAAVNHTGRSSMEVGIKVLAEDIRSQQRRHVTSSYFTTVAVDDAGRPAEVPPLHPATESQARRFQQAALRKRSRLELIQRLASTEPQDLPQPRRSETP